MINLQKKFVIGTRSSKLALQQSQLVQKKLQQLAPEFEFEIKKISTEGDRKRNKQLSELATSGLFIRDLEIALLTGKIDLAVHSFKDLPTILPEQLKIGGIIERANPLDVLAGSTQKLADLPSGARLGTGSLRRKSQLLAYRPDLKIIPIRGNIETRLNKIKEVNLAGVILAAAGLERLNLTEEITEYISPGICLPAARQGAIAVEIKKDSKQLQELLKAAEDEQIAIPVWAEQQFLKKMNAGCHAPLACYARLEAEQLVITATAAALDGSKLIRQQKILKNYTLTTAVNTAVQLAEEMMAAGAEQLIAAVRK